MVREYLLQRIKQILDRNKGYGYDGEVEIIDDVETNVIFPGETKGGLTVSFPERAERGDTDG